jgi:hypothetical protein
MRRQLLTDGTRWFDLDSARRFEEKTTWNGSHLVSVATGSQGEHETLYHAAGGEWVKHFSSYQGRGENWTLLETEEAHAWLLRNGHEGAAPESGSAGIIG